MSSFNSIKRAQTIKLCELCQEDSIKWRCIDCNMCLCEKCKIFHLRVPVTSRHQIVPIGTPLKDVNKKIFIDNIPCDTHSKKMACLFCRSCDSLICPDCASSIHKKHNFDSLQSAIGEKLDNLRGIRDMTNNFLKLCESKTSEVQDTRIKYNAIFDKSMTNIKEKEQELTDAIRKHSIILQEQVENERSQVNTTLSRTRQDVENTKTDLEDKKEEIDTILNSSQGSLIFQATVNIEDLKFDSLPNEVEQFIPKTHSSIKIQEIFGGFQNKSITITHVPPEMNFEVIRTLTTDLPVVSHVVTLDETSAWISCFKQDILRKINIEDNNMTTSEEVPLTIIDMALTPGKTLILSVFNDTDIKLLKRSGKMEFFIKVEPLLPIGIHVTRRNDVIVGVREPGNVYTPTDQSLRAIIIYGINGKKRHAFQNDKDGMRLFTNPTRITTNNNQDILVVDRTSDYTGRVVVLKEEGEFRWIYGGHYKLNATVKFNPIDIVKTAVGHAIVSDFGSHALHVLSENGEVLTCKVMRDLGIIGPCALDIDNEGKLWLGCNEVIDKPEAKIHIIKFNF